MMLGLAERQGSGLPPAGLLGRVERGPLSLAKKRAQIPTRKKLCDTLKIQPGFKEDIA